MEKFVLASVGNVELYDPANGELIVSSQTLTESGIGFSVTAEDVRGGQSNALLAQYFHDSAMTLTMTDALFSLDYLALNVGGTITTTDVDVITMETITTTTANQITVSDTPQNVGSFGVIGWYSISGANEWTKITFNAETKTASAPNLPNGTKVCVKYAKIDAGASQFTVSSAFIPSQVFARLTLPLFKAGTENAQTSSSKVGEVQVEIPNFILSGAVDLSLTSGGASTTQLSGNALATFTGNTSCDGSDNGYYGILKQVVYNADEYADIKDIAVEGANIELATTETQTIKVIGLYGAGIKAPKTLSNANLTFTSSAQAVATVGAHTGVVTAVSEGTANIEITVTTASGKTFTTYAVVTVED